MAIHICPKCNQQGFGWSVDPEVSDKTIWWCNQCQYSAQEDESLETECPTCKTESSMLLVDEEQTYRYFVHCRRITQPEQLGPNRTVERDE